MTDRHHSKRGRRVYAAILKLRAQGYRVNQTADRLDGETRYHKRIHSIDGKPVTTADMLDLAGDAEEPKLPMLMPLGFKK